MAWVLISEGTTFEEFAQRMPPPVELAKGCPVKFVLELKIPVGKAFDLPGAELLFKPVIPEGLKLVDVYSEHAYNAVIDCEVDPPWTWAAVGAFLLKNWKFLSLAAIGLGFVLAEILRAIRMYIPEEWLPAPPVPPDFFRSLAEILPMMIVLIVLIMMIRIFPKKL